MFCNIYTWGGRRRKSAVAAEARHLGRSVWGEAHRSRRREMTAVETLASKAKWIGCGGETTTTGGCPAISGATPMLSVLSAPVR